MGPVLTQEYSAYGPIGGTFLDFNTPLDLSSTRGLNMSDLCKTLIQDNIWNQYYYSKINEYNPCLDSVDPNIDPSVDPLSTHNLYGYRHMKVVSIPIHLVYFYIYLSPKFLNLPS